MRKFTVNLGVDFHDVLLVPLVNENEEYTSRKQIQLVKRTPPFSGVVPIIASNMANIGTFQVAEVLSKFGMLTALHKYYTLENFKSLYKKEMNVIVSSGMREEEVKNLRSILNEYPDLQYINLDVANGYMRSFAKFVESIKKEFPTKTIIAGNVATPEGAKHLVSYGADVIKIGIGNGSACLTRHTTGVGYPQLQALLECYYSLNVPIISDGGIVNLGDIAKAFAAGASAVMMGSLFANTKETGNVYYGMSSTYAQKQFNTYADYKSNEGDVIKFSEQEKRDLSHICKLILGGLRSSLSYCNSMNIDDFIGKGNFIASTQIYNDKWKTYK